MADITSSLAPESASRGSHREGPVNAVTGPTSINPYLTSVLTSILEPLADLGVLPIPRWPNGLDRKYWGPIVDVPTPQPRVIAPNVLQSKVGSGDRRIMTGGLNAHMEGGNYLDMSVAANIYLESAVPAPTYPFTLACVVDGASLTAGQTPLSIANTGNSSDFKAIGFEPGGNVSAGRSDGISGSIGATSTLSWQDKGLMVAAVSFISDTSVRVAVNGKTQLLTGLGSIVMQGEDSLMAGKLRPADSVQAWTSLLSACLYIAAELTDDEHANLYETLMHNKGYPLAIPQVENLVRGYLLNERSGSICFDIANPLIANTAVEIQNYTPTVRARSADLPKQSLNDQSCSEAWRSGGGMFLTNFTPTDVPNHTVEVVGVFAGAGTEVICGSYTSSAARTRIYFSNGLLIVRGGNGGGILGPTLTPGQGFAVRMMVTQATKAYTAEYNIGAGWVAMGANTYPDSLSDVPLGVCATSFAELPESPFSGVIAAYKITDDDTGMVLVDSKQDGFGEAIGSIELILLPNQVKSPELDIADHTPDFIGSAPRDILLEQSNAFLGSNSSDRFAFFPLTVAESPNGKSYAKLSVWVATAETAANRYVVSCPRAGGGNAFEISLSVTQVTAVVRTSGSAAVTVFANGNYSGTTLSLEYNNGEITLASNGTTIATGTAVGALESSANELAINAFDSTFGLTSSHTVQDVKLYVDSPTNLVKHIPCSEGNGRSLACAVSGAVEPIQAFAAAAWVKTGGVARNASDGFSFARWFTSASQTVADTGQKYFSGKGDFHAEFEFSGIWSINSAMLSEYSTNGIVLQLTALAAGEIIVWLNNTTFGARTVQSYNNGEKHKLSLDRIGDQVTLTVGSEVINATFADTLNVSPTKNTEIGNLTAFPQGFDGVIRNVKLGDANGSAGHYRLDESFREVVAVDSAGISDGTYVGFSQNELDVVRIPASDADKTIDAWGLPVGNLGLNYRSDGVTHNDHESVENWSGRDYQGNLSLAPYTREYAGHVEADGTAWVTLDPAKVSGTPTQIVFEIDARSSSIDGETRLLSMTDVTDWFNVYWVNASEIGFYVGDTLGSYGVAPPADGEWHSLKFTFDTDLGESELFSDGQKLGSTVPIVDVRIVAMTLAKLLGRANTTGSLFIGDARNARLLYDGVEVLRIPFAGSAIDYAQDAVLSETNTIYPRSSSPVARVYNEVVEMPGYVAGDTVDVWTKTGGADGVWNNAQLQSGDAHSGAFELTWFMASEPSKKLMLGANESNNATIGYADINFCLHNVSNAEFRVYENGISVKVINTTTAVGSKLKITRDVGGTVKYYIDDVLEYTSLVTSVANFYVDSTFFNIGSSIANARVNDALVNWTNTDNMSMTEQLRGDETIKQWMTPKTQRR